jgi:alpha-L-rhamnosidase
MCYNRKRFSEYFNCMRLVLDDFLDVACRSGIQRGVIQMSRRTVILFFVSCASGFASLCLTAVVANADSNLTKSRLHPLELRSEYLPDPLGLDTSCPRLSWRIEAPERNQVQSAYQVLVASDAKLLASDQADLWDSGKVTSCETNQIEYAGAPLQSRQQCFWKVRVWDGVGQESDWSEVARWSMGLLKPDDWQATWISHRDDTPVHQSRDELYLPAPRLYRQQFDSGDDLVRATVYASALGIYDLYINGELVSHDRFRPGWSDYRKRAYYNTFDVTEQLRAGGNVIGAELAEGWYSGYVGFGLLVGYGPYKTGRCFYGKTPALLMQLELEYRDGSRKVVATDASWSVTGDHGTREADLLMGEMYDARRSQPGWATVDYDARNWESAILAKQNGSTTAPYYDTAGEREVELGFVPPEKLQAYPGPPIRATREIRPVGISEPNPGVFIFDMGQNFSGVARLHVKGPAGTKIRLRFGEMLHEDGRLMTENLRRARATDHYILRGDAEGETWEPRFTYHGFRFVEVTGFPGRPPLDAITGVVLHSDTPLTSSFECSDPMVNQFYHNVVWTQISNFVEVPTDCPQRDERLGWTGDAQAYVRTATYNADVAAFFTKWEYDLVESQRENGAYPAYAPFPMQHGKRKSAFGTAWMDAGIICPWTIWQVYGDTRMLEHHWDSMTRFMEFRRKISPDFRGKFVGNDWGDWLCVGAETPIEFIDAAYFALTARMMSQMAAAIGRDDEARDYATLFDRIAAVFVEDYVNSDGTLKVDTQTAYALALFVELVPENLRKATGRHLAKKIEANGFLMSTGFLGTRPLLPALSAVGQHDLAARLLQNQRYPSWGYEVVNGATTVWERWNSYTRDKGFMNPSMNSFSHYAFGAVCEWMFQDLAGIDTAEPGYRHILIQPQIPAAVDTAAVAPQRDPIRWVKAKYVSINGPIVANWRNESERFQLHVNLPANTSATLRLPIAARFQGIVTESGQPLDGAAGVRQVTREGRLMELELGSGKYQFEVR